MSLKNLKDLQTKIENTLNEKFTEFPGRLWSKAYYYPVLQGNLNSTRYFLYFKRGTTHDSAVLGDWSTNDRHTFKIQFSVKNYASKEPSSEEYEKKQKEFIDLCLSFNLKKGFTPYLKEFTKLPAVCLAKNGVLYVPYKTGNKLKALLKVFPSGKKMYVKGSDPQGAFCVLKSRSEPDTLVYICEGIRTAYACLKACPDNGSVMSVGSINNIENAIKLVLKQNQKPVLCAEKASFSRYISLKNKYKKEGCLMVGSRTFDDMFSIYEELGLDLLKKNMTTFEQDSFIPIGVDEKGKILIYIKYMKNVFEYAKDKAKELFCDCNNVTEPPTTGISEQFYWNTRFLCRVAGIVKYYLKIKEGVLPHKNKMYYYDTVNLYLIKDDIQKIDPEVIISPDAVLCSEKNLDLPDLTKLSVLDKDQIKAIFSYLNLFGLDPFSQKLLKGWIVQSIVCGGLPYRAPLWIIAPTGTGKSQLTSRLLKSFFIFYERKTGRQTTAKWIHRNFNGKAIALQRDEYDPSKRYAGATEDEMECVRTSSTERFPERGISAGIDDSVQSFVYCFSALYTSTRKPLELSDPDMARFVFISLTNKFSKNYNKQIKRFQNMMTIEMKSRLTKTCLLKMREIRKTFESYMSVVGYSDRGHKKSSLLMLSACHNALFEDKITPAELKPHLESMKVSQSRILKVILKLSLKKAHYNFGITLNLFTILNDPEYHLFNKENGLYLIQKDKKFCLYINKKKGITFLQRLFKENGQFYSEQILISELENDGPFFLKNLNLGKLKKQIIPRGFYLVFDWEKIKEEFLGE